MIITKVSIQMPETEWKRLLRVEEAGKAMVRYLESTLDLP